MAEDNPDLDLDPTMWIPVPAIPERWPRDLPARVEAEIRRFRQRESERALREAQDRREHGKTGERRA